MEGHLVTFQSGALVFEESRWSQLQGSINGSSVSRLSPVLLVSAIFTHSVDSPVDLSPEEDHVCWLDGMWYKPINKLR